MTDLAQSEAILAAAPYVGRFVGKVFGVEAEIDHFREMVRRDDPLWRFKKDFAKKRILREGAGKSWTFGPELAAAVAKAALQTMSPAPVGGTTDEERTIANAALPLLQIDDVARKAAKGGGAVWTDELRARARKVQAAVRHVGPEIAAHAGDDDGALGTAVAFALDALEAWIAGRHADPHDSVRRWPTLHVPKNINWEHLVETVHHDPALPELFVGPEHERRQREGFSLTDRRMRRARGRGRDRLLHLLPRPRQGRVLARACVDAKTGRPQEEPARRRARRAARSRRRSARCTRCVRRGDIVAALALVMHRQPDVPRHRSPHLQRLHEGLHLPEAGAGQHPADRDARAHRGARAALGLRDLRPAHALEPAQRQAPARAARTTARTCSSSASAPRATRSRTTWRARASASWRVDGLKIEPLDPKLVGSDGHGAASRSSDFATLYGELDERILLGFGGVSEYGITVRWDKNFLTLLYLTLARSRTLRIYGGVRFGGTLTLEDAWALGFDHVAIAAGAGRPTIIDMKNNLVPRHPQGQRLPDGPAAHRRLQAARASRTCRCSLPAIVIGGGLTAIDTATELLAYYLVQVEKDARALRDARRSEQAADERPRACSTTRSGRCSSGTSAHARALARRARARREGRARAATSSSCSTAGAA